MHRSINPTPSADSHKPFEKIVPVICGTALTVAAIAGVAARHSAGRSANVAGAPASVSAITRSIAPAPLAFRFYLVASKEQAGLVEATLRTDASSTDHIVAAVTSPEELREVQAAAAEIDNAMIVDLRAAEASATAVPQANGDDDIRIYLVGSQVQADEVANGGLNQGAWPGESAIVRSGTIEEAKRVRTGYPNIQVLDIVASGGEEAETRSRLATINQIRRASGQSPVRIVDLREP